MRINPHRDTFFNLINFKTSPETQKSKNREQSKTKQHKNTEEQSPKIKAHHKNSIKHKADVFTAVYQKPTNHKPKKANQAQKHLKSKTTAFTKSHENASESKT